MIDYESNEIAPAFKRGSNPYSVAPHAMLKQRLRTTNESTAIEMEEVGLLTPEAFCERVMGKAGITVRHAHVVNAALSLGARVGATHTAHQVSQFSAQDHVHTFVRVLRHSYARPLPVMIKAGESVDVARIFQGAVDLMPTKAVAQFIGDSEELTFRDFADFIFRERLVHVSKNAQGPLIANISKLAASKASASCFGGVVQLGPSRRQGYMHLRLITPSSQPAMA
jgi:hypothetical protein